MLWIQLNAGGDRNFAYLVAPGPETEGVLVDPGGRVEEILRCAEGLGVRIRYCLNTHGHRDHTGGNALVHERTGAAVVAYDPRRRREPGFHGVADGDILEVAGLHLRVLHTPGHSPDSVCFLCEGKLLTGDTLFVGKVGGTGLGEDARQEYESLHEKLLALPDDVEVYPGHNYGIATWSTIGRERRLNPFLLQPDFAAFLELKRTWGEYKRRHGIG